MSVRLCLIAMLSLLGSRVFAAEPVAGVPDTPAGHALGSWLDAFNSGDRARIDSFDKARFPALDIEGAMRFRNQTGAFDLLGIEKSAPTQIIFHVRRKSGLTEAMGVLLLSGSDPSVIAALRFFPMPPGAKFEEVTLDAAARSRIIAAVARLLDESYVFKDVANKMTAALRAKEKHGEYNTIVDGEVFAVKLSDDLRDFSHDPHLELRYSPVAQPPEEPAKDAQAEPVQRRQMMSINCGFEKAEHLSPNIGYLKFNMFADPAICASTDRSAELRRGQRRAYPRPAGQQRWPRRHGRLDSQLPVRRAHALHGWLRPQREHHDAGLDMGVRAREALRRQAGVRAHVQGHVLGG